MCVINEPYDVSDSSDAEDTEDTTDVSDAEDTSDASDAGPPQCTFDTDCPEGFRCGIEQECVPMSDAGDASTDDADRDTDPGDAEIELDVGDGDASCDPGEVYNPLAGECVAVDGG